MGQRKPTAHNPIDVHVGDRLRTRRMLLGLAQTAVADAIGITFQQLQKYETGSNRVSASRLYDLARVLDVDMTYFFDGMDKATAKASPGQLLRGDSALLRENSVGNKSPLHKRETLELVRAYYRISDPAVRRDLRKLIQSITAS